MDRPSPTSTLGFGSQSAALNEKKWTSDRAVAATSSAKPATNSKTNTPGGVHPILALQNALLKERVEHKENLERMSTGTVTSIPARKPYLPPPKVKLYEPPPPPIDVDRSPPPAWVLAPPKVRLHEDPPKPIDLDRSPSPSWASVASANTGTTPPRPSTPSRSKGFQDASKSRFKEDGMGGTMSEADRDRQLRALIDNMVSLGDDVDMSKANVKGLSCTLMPHQIQGLQWMQEREKGSGTGGILADDMGLGKTIQMLALMVTHPPGATAALPSGKVDQVSSTKTLSKAKAKAQPEVALTKAINGKGTLVIAPLGVMKEWESAIETKVDRGVMRVLVHHGSSRAKSGKVFESYDVVITTYATAASEWSNTDAGKYAVEAEKKRSKKKNAVAEDSDDSFDEDVFRLMPKTASKPAPLFEHNWHRIVLDEGHTIKNHKAKMSKGCFALSKRAKLRWILSGTPIQNNAYEIYSLIHFLLIPPFDDYKEFRDKIGMPLTSTNQNRVNWGMKRLCAVLQTIMLRRTKESKLDGKPLISLPARIVQVIKTEFVDPSEREYYAKLEKAVKDRFKEEAKKDNMNYINSLVLLLRLRQACNHPALTANAALLDAPEEIETTAPTADGADNDEVDELAGLMASMAVGSGNCKRCMRPILNAADKTCSECATELASETARAWTDPARCSTKIRTMLDLLENTRKADPTEKTIVFSQFTSFLDVVEPFLKKNGYKYARYDGSMRPQLRDDNLTKIRNDLATTVLLISFKAGSTGLNLTCCSQVILMDLWWNPQIEEQAFDRAHRLGQTRDVKIFKMSVAETVEERILVLQDRKKALAKAALEGSKLAKGNKLTRAELTYLFDGAPIDQPPPPRVLKNVGV